MFGWKPFTFAALNPKHEPTPVTSPKQKPNPETLTSGDSNFESARESPDLELVEGKPHLETKQTELIKEGPQFKFEETKEPLAKSGYWTEPQPEQPYSPIKNLFSSIINLN
jgi:hypothetical protein